MIFLESSVSALHLPKQNMDIPLLVYAMGEVSLARLHP